MGRDLRHEERPGLYCVEIRTENWAELLEWYRQVIGLKVLVRVIDDGYALLEAGDARLALLARDTAGEPSKRISLAFEVADMRPMLLRLMASGSPISHPERDPEGLRETNTEDPDGNRIRLFCWPQGR